MIKVLEQAIERVRALPEAQQVYAAHVLDELAADGGVYRLDAAERADIGEALSEMARGEVASDSEVAAVFKRLTA